MPLVRLRLSTPGLQVFSYTTELAGLLDIKNEKSMILRIYIYKELNFWREIRIKDIHWREDNNPTQALTTTTLERSRAADMYFSVNLNLVKFNTVQY